MSEERESPIVRAREELDAFEAAAFRFGQRMRAFLNSMPVDLPEPYSVLPRFMSEHGRAGYGVKSYAHLTFMDPAAVEAWADWLGVSVTRSVDAPGGQAFVRAEGVLDGFRVFVACLTKPTDEELQQARLRDTVDGA